MPGILLANASEGEIIDFIDQWISLLEQEKYGEALAAIETEGFWTVPLLKDAIKDYGEALDDQVTLTNNGLSLDGLGELNPATQRKEITWFDEQRGEVWYDLNINGLVSDLTATFELKKQGRYIHVILSDIHVM